MDNSLHGALGRHPFRNQLCDGEGDDGRNKDNSTQQIFSLRMEWLGPYCVRELICPSPSGRQKGVLNDAKLAC